MKGVGSLREEAPDSFNAVAFSPDGKLLAAGSSDSTIRLWDVASGRETRVLRGHPGVVSCLAFAPDGNTLATGSTDKRVLLWEAASPQAVAAALAEGPDRMGADARR